MSDDEVESLSKSARKREAERLKEVGKALAERSTDALESLNLPEDLFESLVAFKQMGSHGARRRQLQLIGKFLRDLSEEDGRAVENAIATQDGTSAAAIAAHAELERWRDELLASDDALTDYLHDHPETDRQKLRQLIKRTRSAANEQSRSTSARALFRFLRDG